MVTGMGRKKQAREHRGIRRWEHYFAPLHPCAFVPLLLLLPTLLLWSVTFGGKTLVPADLLLVMSPWRHFAKERFPEFERVKAPLLDVLQQYYPWRKFYADTLRQGELPLWNPFMFCGTSFVGNGMSAIFYPLNLLFIIMPIDLAFGWCAWLHLVLAGIFMFGFLRRFLSPVAALTGAIAFQLCGFFVAWLAYLPLLCTAVWLPAALWAYEAGCRSPTRCHAYTLTPLCLGMALLAGHPQIAFYVLWAFGAYVIIRSVVTSSLRHFITGIMSLLLGIALGAAQLLPLLEMAKLSQRSGAEAIAAAAGNRLFVDQFVRLFVPSFFGDWRSGTHFFWDFARFNFVERTGYPSAIAFLLAGVSLTALRWRNSLEAMHASPLPLAGLFFTLIGLSAASVPFVHRFMALGLPGTQAFVGISRALFLFDFGIAILCAVGMERMAKGEWRTAERKARLVVIAPLLVATLVMAICVSYGVTVHAPIAFHPLLRDFTLAQICRWLAFIALGIATVIIPSAPTRPYSLRITLYTLPFLIAADLLVFAWGQHPEAERSMVFFETPSIRWLIKHIGSQRFIAVGKDAIKHWTPSNTLMVYRLRDAKGSDSLMTGRFNRFARAWDERAFSEPFAVRNFTSPLLDLMAVRYIIAAEQLSLKERKGLRLVHRGDLWIYENPDALPRAFVVTEFRRAKTPQDALRQIIAADFNPHRFVVIESPSDVRYLTSDVRHPTSRLVRDGINRLDCQITLSQPGALVLADGAYPGWQAFGQSDGKGTGNGKWQRLPLFVADYAFRAVLIPAGKWQVAWVYFPSSIIVGLFLSLAAMGVMAVTIVACLHRKSKK